MHLGSKTETARKLTSARSAAACSLALVASWLLPPSKAEARGGHERMNRAEWALLRAINSTRAQHGLASLRRSRRLQRSADYHSWDMVKANFFAHTSSNGTPMAQRVRRYSKSNRIGENLAYVSDRSGHSAAQLVVSLWMNSPPHRHLLLSSGFRRIGIARRVGSLGGGPVAVYTADFASAH